MPVVAKFGRVVIRVLIDRTFGTHFHAFYGDSELVIGVNPVRVIQGDVPAWVQEWALEWVKYHQTQLFSGRMMDVNLATPFSRQAAGHFALTD